MNECCKIKLKLQSNSVHPHFFCWEAMVGGGGGLNLQPKFSKDLNFQKGVIEKEGDDLFRGLQFLRRK